VPCGVGEFLGQVRRFFPAAQVWVADVHPTVPQELSGLASYAFSDLSRVFPFTKEDAFDVVTSISGIICFANTAQFVARCA
jgi:hypothetical protein